MTFKVGDRVQIAESSVYWKENNRVNPRYVVGTVRELDSRGMAVLVLWDNGEQNGYEIPDLLSIHSTGGTVNLTDYFSHKHRETILTTTSMLEIVQAERRTGGGDKQYIVRPKGSTKRSIVFCDKDIDSLCASLMYIKENRGLR